MLLTNVSKTLSIHTKGFLQSILHATWPPEPGCFRKYFTDHYHLQSSLDQTFFPDVHPHCCPHPPPWPAPPSCSNLPSWHQVARLCLLPIGPLCILAVNFLKLGCCLVSIENLVLSLWLLLLLTVARFAIIGYLCCSHFCSASCCLVLLLLLLAVRLCLSFLLPNLRLRLHLSEQRACHPAKRSSMLAVPAPRAPAGDLQSNFTCLHSAYKRTMSDHK